MITPVCRPGSRSDRHLPAVAFTGRFTIAFTLAFMLASTGPGCGLFPAAGQDAAPPAAALQIRSTVLEQLLQQNRTEQKPVATTFLNSQVVGSQTTFTETRLQIIPNSQPLQFEVHTHGDVSSHTTGMTPQAAVESLGTHRFEVIKPFWFDGKRFTTRQSHGNIQVYQNPQRVISAAGARMPLLAPLTDQIAWNRVLRMQPQINQAVAENVSQDLFQQVDRKVELEFVRLEQQWQTGQLLLQQLLPASSRWSAEAQSDSVRFSINSRVGSRSAAAPRTQPTSDSQPAAPGNPTPHDDRPKLLPPEDVVLNLSDAALTELACSLIPHGTRIPDTSLQRFAEACAGLINGQQHDLSQFNAIINDNPQPTLFSLEFPRQQPCSIVCANEELQLQLCFRILPVVGTDSGWMSTTLFLRSKRLSPTSWTLVLRDFAVNNADSVLSSSSPNSNSIQTTDNAPDTRTTGTAWPALVRTRLAALLKSSNEPHLPTEIPLPLPGRTPANLRLQQIDCRNRQLRMAFNLRTTRTQPQLPSPQTPPRQQLGMGPGPAR